MTSEAGTTETLTETLAPSSARAPRTLRVLLVDDHPFLRQGLRHLLTEAGDITVSGEAATAEQALAAFDETPFDVAVVDQGLPGRDGISLAAAMRERDPRCAVLMLTASPLEEVTEPAKAAGVRGVISKLEAPEVLVQAIRAMGRDDARPPSVSRLPASPGDPIGSLSARERQVFLLAVDGLSNDAMAARLLISVKTIETHRSRINQKLQVHSTADLVRFAMRNRLITP